MPAKVILLSLILIIMVSITMVTVEFFLPLSAKADMNLLCRKYALQMEICGGLTLNSKNELYEKLSEIGFKDIVIEGTERAAFGDELNLKVEVGYIYNKMSSFFTRSDVSKRMIYHKTSISRKVIN
jgi:hypothetical protein